MSAAKLFPVPLEACGNLIREDRTADNPAGFLVAEVALGSCDASARARVFAASPEMLEALKACVEIMARMYGGSADKAPPLDRARAAIEKATGCAQ